jgi:hypothetical protein
MPGTLAAPVLEELIKLPDDTHPCIPPPFGLHSNIWLFFELQEARAKHASANSTSERRQPDGIDPLSSLII